MPENRKHSSPEVSDIFRAVARKVSLERYTNSEKKILSAIIRCRTAELGGHLTYCTKCEYKEQSYNSCLNRHCPKCKGGKVFQWVESRQSELLPVRYFHLVFTIPSELRGIFQQNKELCYNLLFKASSETLNQVANTKHQARLGYFGVLHTWNQELLYHPHIHFVIPAGGMASSGWKSIGTQKFFLPVRILSKVYQGKLIYYLKQAYRRSSLNFFGSLSHLKDTRSFEHQMSKATTSNWVVYAKRPFAGPDTVIKYLSSYTHRIGISNKRIRSLTENSVHFSARHKTNKKKKIIVTISPEEFARRFLLHTMKRSFRRIRYFGFLVNSERVKSIAQIRSLIGTLSTVALPSTSPSSCPACSCHALKRQKLPKPHSFIKEISPKGGWPPSSTIFL